MLYDKNIATLCCNFVMIKIADKPWQIIGLRPATLLIKRLWHRYFPVNFAKFIRTTLAAASGVLIDFAILEPFSNKVAGLFNRIPMVAPSDFSLQ